nr:MAG TPA: hypothetical protein [Caudoviricetes sp.]
MVAVAQRLVFLVAAFQRFHTIWRNFSGLKVMQAQIDDFRAQQHFHAALHSFVLLICVSDARPRPPGKRRYDGQQGRKQVLKEVPHSLYLRNVFLGTRKTLVRFSGVLLGCVGALRLCGCALVRFIRAAGLGIRPGIRCFKLCFKLGCIAARTSLRHAGRERVARGKRHQLAAVGQHHGVTLHSRHENTHPAVPAGAAHLGLHRVAHALSQLSAVIVLVHRIHIGRGEHLTFAARHFQKLHVAVLRFVDCFTVCTHGVGVPGVCRWVKPRPGGCGPHLEMAVRKGRACQRRVARAAHHRQRVAAFHPLAHGYQIPRVVAEIQAVHRVRRLVRVQLHAHVPAPFPRFAARGPVHLAGRNDPPGNAFALVIGHPDGGAVQPLLVAAAMPALAVVPGIAPPAVPVPHPHAALKNCHVSCLPGDFFVLRFRNNAFKDGLPHLRGAPQAHGIPFFNTLKHWLHLQHRVCHYSRVRNLRLHPVKRRRIRRGPRGDLCRFLRICALYGCAVCQLVVRAAIRPVQRQCKVVALRVVVLIAVALINGRPTRRVGQKRAAVHIDDAARFVCADMYGILFIHNISSPLQLSRESIKSRCNKRFSFITCH